MTDRWSTVLVIETDGDPAVVLSSLREAYGIASAGGRYVGPHARLIFSPPLREQDVP